MLEQQAPGRGAPGRLAQAGLRQQQVVGAVGAEQRVDGAHIHLEVVRRQGGSSRKGRGWGTWRSVPTGRDVPTGRESAAAHQHLESQPTPSQPAVSASGWQRCYSPAAAHHQVVIGEHDCPVAPAVVRLPLLQQCEAVGQAPLGPAGGVHGLAQRAAEGIRLASVVDDNCRRRGGGGGQARPGQARPGEARPGQGRPGQGRQAQQASAPRVVLAAVRASGLGQRRACRCITHTSPPAVHTCSPRSQLASSGCLSHFEASKSSPAGSTTKYSRLTGLQAGQGRQTGRRIGQGRRGHAGRNRAG